MNLIALQRTLRQLRLGGMAEVLETHLHQTRPSPCRWSTSCPASSRTNWTARPRIRIGGRILAGRDALDVHFGDYKHHDPHCATVLFQRLGIEGSLSWLTVLGTLTVILPAGVSMSLGL